MTFLLIFSFINRKLSSPLQGSQSTQAHKHSKSLCYLRWRYDQILAIAPQCMGENRRKSLSTTLHTSWESRRVNPIFLTHLAGDVSQWPKLMSIYNGTMETKCAHTSNNRFCFRCSLCQAEILIYAMNLM